MINSSLLAHTSGPLWNLPLLGAVVVAAAVYLVVVGPGRLPLPNAAPLPWVRRLGFLFGLLVLYLTIGSPLDAVADDYLFSAHMVEHALLAFVVPPFLLAGTPGWLLRPLLHWAPTSLLLRVLTRPAVAGLLFNVLFSAVHAPDFVSLSLQNERLHYAEHVALLFTALLLYWPLLSPLPELPRLHPTWQMLYLFLNGLATLPMFLLMVTSNVADYPPYAAAPRLLPLTPLEDQQLAAMLMNLLLIAVFGFFLVRAYLRFAREDAPNRNTGSNDE